MIRKAKKILTSLTIAGALAGAASAQTPTFKQTFVGLPEANYCQIDLAGMGGKNNVIVKGSSNGEAVGEITGDLSDGKAARMYTFQMSKAPTDIVVEGQARFSAEMTCVSKVAEYRFVIPFLWQPIVIPILSSQTVPAQEFGTQRFTTFSKNPADVFNHDPANTPTFSNKIIIGNQTDAASPYMALTTAQVDPSKSQTGDHTAYRQIPRGTSSEFTLDELMNKTAVANSGNGTVKLQAADGTVISANGYQRFTSPFSAFNVSLPVERAAHQHYLTHIFTPQPGEQTANNWENAVAIQNTGSDAATVYVRPYNAAGKLLDEVGVVMKIAPGQSYQGLTQDLLKNIPNYTQTAWAEVTSNQDVQVVELMKYNNQILAVPASNSLDAGRAVRANRLQFNGGSNTSIALLNPGSTAETVAATVYDASGKQVPLADAQGNKRNTITFTLGPKQKVAARLDELLQTDVSSVAPGSYVTFTSLTPESTKPIDLYDHAGRLVGMAVHADWNSGLHVEAMNLENLDRYRVLFEKSTFNPRDKTEYDEENSGQADVKTTVISSDRNITSVTWDPLAKGDLTKGYSANLKTSKPDRMFFAEGKTVNGPLLSEIKFIIQTLDVERHYTPLLTINMTDGSNIPQKQEIVTQMSYISEQNVYPEQSKAGYSIDAIRNNPDGWSEMYFRNRGAFTNPVYNTLTLDDFKRGTKFLLDPAFADHWTSMQINDVGTNAVVFYTPRTPAGTFAADRINEGVAGEKFVDELKNFFKLGYKWTHDPNLK